MGAAQVGERANNHLGEFPRVSVLERIHDLLFSSNTIRFDLVLFISAFLAFFFVSDSHLNDYDAVNYALAVREFNVTLDMPHPPGAPIFVFLARLLYLVVADIPLSLLILSAAGGACFVIIWRRIFNLFLSPRTAAVGAMILAVSPGVWITSTQLMSDALAAALLSGSLLLALYYSRNSNPIIFLLFTALLALSVGCRPQFGLLAIFLHFSSMLYFRIPLKTCLHAIAVFFVINLAWLLPTIYSQYNLDGSGWMTYFNQIIRFKEGFGAASGSPILAANIDAFQVAKRIVTHIGSLGYFGLGLNLWYPDSISTYLHKLGTELNPWHKGETEWTYTGSLYTLVYMVCFAVLFTRTAYYKKRVKRSFKYLGFLTLFANAYFVFVVMMAPPHIRYYLPIMPFFVLLALLGAQSSLFNNKLQYVLLLAALASAIPSLSESITTNSPPVALVDDVRAVSNETGQGTVLILNSNASRHATWYLPDAKLIIRERSPEVLDLANLFANGNRVFSNYSTALPADQVIVEKMASYRRSFRVWMRHTSTGLYELKLNPQVVALSAE